MKDRTDGSNSRRANRLVELGDEIRYEGKRWRLDDEALIGLEGQGHLLWGEFDPEELEPDADG